MSFHFLKKLCGMWHVSVVLLLWQHFMLVTHRLNRILDLRTVFRLPLVTEY